MSRHMSLHMSVHMPVHISVHMSVRMSVHMSMNMSAHILYTWLSTGLPGVGVAGSRHQELNVVSGYVSAQHISHYSDPKY